ncbi:acyltransferase [Aeromicrobium duanguangcaii]|uniref:acyltransferase n=1 Tax=Aeromicrobium duanguangcaii TaxID=2968086 RepID=UPI002741AACB|nr:acyltransferase [Aeromicrobium duanguangcaii]
MRTLTARLSRLRRRVMLRLRGYRHGVPGAKVGSGVQLGGPGTYALGAGAVVRQDARAWVGPGATLTVGPNANLGIRNIINVAAGLTIGAHTELSWDVQISDTDFHDIAHSDGVQRPRTAPVVIGEHVLVGARAMILKGVTIGDGAIVGAGAVVASDVPPPMRSWPATRLVSSVVPTTGSERVDHARRGPYAGVPARA